MTKAPSTSANLFPKALRGLSGKVLVLTIIFVMLGEVLIFLPSIANFRIQWFKARIAQAEIGALAAEASADKSLSDALSNEILKGAGVSSVSLKRGDTRQLMLQGNDLDMVKQTFDLRPGMYALTLPEAISALLRDEDRMIAVIDYPPNMSGELIEIALHERPLTTAMRQYGLNILLLSVFLSLVVAAMIFAVLNRVLVRPMQKLSANMTAFGEQPEDINRIISPTDRSDEIGTAERQLHAMQSQLQGLLHQKSRLAALGLAVSKVSHDLRNMLTSAQLISDRLGEVKDPVVQRFAPKLIISLDRAIGFLNQTLKYGQAHEPPPRRTALLLQQVTEDVVESMALAAPASVSLHNDVNPGLRIDADREHLNRILTNLVRNALQAIESLHATADAQFSVRIGASRHGSVTEIEVADNGPGIPEAVRHRLFEAFQSAARPGGTGLGLAISAELVHAHGGSIDVKQSTENGTIFRVSIPDAPIELQQRRFGT